MVLSTQTSTIYLYNFSYAGQCWWSASRAENVLEIGNNHLEQEVEQIFGKPVADTTRLQKNDLKNPGLNLEVCK